jgi:excisionase family DNA binding protein
MDELLTVKEVAKALKISPHTVYKLTRKRKIPFLKIDGIGIRFNPEKIKEFLSSQELPLDTCSPPQYISQYEKKEGALGNRKSTIGTVYPRATKDGRIRWYMDFYYQGKRIRKVCKYALTKEQALEALRMEIVNLHKKQLGLEERKRITFKEFSKLYMENYSKPNKKSWRGDYYTLRHFVKNFGSYYLDEITPLEIEEFRAKRLKKVKKSTTNRDLALLKRMFNLAIEWGYCEKNPVKKVKLFPERENLKERILTEEEELRLLANSAEHLRPILITALNTGMRLGEILNLKWEDVNFKERIIVLRETKSKKQRIIPINEILSEELLRLKLRNGKSSYVFINPENGKPLRSVKRAFKGAVRRAGIEALRFHDLRHTFATRLVQKGVDVETVKELLGHHSIRITQRYLHSNLKVKKDAVERLTWSHFSHIEGGNFINACEKRS